MAKERDERSANLKAALFAEEYLRHNCNGTEAARACGHTGTDASLAVIASRLLKSVKVQEHLKARRKQIAMDVDEIIARLADEARGSMEDFQRDDDPERLDLAKGKRLRKMHLVKEFSEKVVKTWRYRQGTGKDAVEVEEQLVERRIKLHDAQAAKRILLDYHGVLRDRTPDLPKDEKELTEVLAEEVERVSGEKVLDFKGGKKKREAS
jgi:phage terminase small subunit